MTICIIGYGVVGQSMERMLSRAFPITVYDPPLGYTNEQHFVNCDFAVICVPTPTTKKGNADLSFLTDVVARLRMARLKAGKTDWPLICIKSTVPPGTTDELNSLYQTDAFHFSPEYLGEGKNYVDSAHYPDKTETFKHDFCIVGGPRADEILVKYFTRVMSTSARFVPVKAVEAELVKYMENTWLATKVVFCNEWARIAKSHGVTYNLLRYLWLLDSRINPSHTLVFPNKPGYDGKCLPKDTAAIIAHMADRGEPASFLVAVNSINGVRMAMGDSDEA